MQEISNSEMNKNKTNILFTALHHSREAVTLNMIVHIFLKYLWKLNHTNWDNHTLMNSAGDSITSEKFFLFGNFVFVPVVNLDGHDFISEKWGTKEYPDGKNKRKNMNLKVKCENNKSKQKPLYQEILSGVDLNRNYDVAFRQDNEGSVDDPCDEIYRGESFILSEKELT